MFVRVVTPTFVAGVELDQEGNTIRCAPILKKWRFEIMLIKITKIYDGKIADKYAAKFVTGNKLDGGEEWTKGFFLNQKDLVQKLSDFSIGDDCNVVLQNNGGHNYKIVDFKEVTDEDRSKIGAYANKSAGGAANSTGGGASVRRADGGSRGDDTNRSAAVYLAREIVMGTKDPKLLVKMDAGVLFAEIAELADTVNDYIKDGLLPAPADGMVHDKDDALNPPTV